MRFQRTEFGVEARRGLTILAIVAAVPSHAQTVTSYSEQNKLIRAPNAVIRLGDDLFGDKVNLYTGTLEFSQTDVSLPGNSTIPVSVGRRLVAGQEAKTGTLFGGWDLEIPHLHGIFSSAKGWTNPHGTGARCSSFGVPPTISTPASGGTASWIGTEYWHGSFLYIPGQGDQEMLVRTASYIAAPAGNPAAAYPLVTRNNWQIRCLPSLAASNGATGEGFVAVSPDGTQYQFDWLATRSLPAMQKSSLAPSMGMAPDPQGDASAGIDTNLPQEIVASPQLNRVEVWILPTVITDRFGNKVSYTYDTANKWQLKSIVGTDAAGSPRTLTLTYVSPGSTNPAVKSVSDGTRTWTYSYSGSGLAARLNTVTLPDGSAWQLAGASPLAVGLAYQGDGNCDGPGIVYDTTASGSMRHPSGATGTFTLTPTRHGRAGVQNNCRFDVMAQTYTATYPRLFDTYALTSKQLGGPGLDTLTWTTQYPEAKSSWAPCNACLAEKTVRVTNPAGDITEHTFGTLSRETEGQLQKRKWPAVPATFSARSRCAIAPQSPLSG